MMSKLRSLRPLSLVVLCALIGLGGVASSAEAQRLPVLGPEITVPAGAGCPVTRPQVAPLGANGGEVWVWTRGDEVEAALFGEGGTTPLDRETVATGVETPAALAHDSSVAWAAWADTGRIDLEAVAVPGTLNPSGSGSVNLGAVSSVALARAADGRMLIVWHHPPGALLRSSTVNVQLVGAGGAAVGGARTVATLTDPLPTGLDVAALADGSFVLTYTEQVPQPRILAHRVFVDGDGVQGAGDPVVVAASSGMGPSPSDVLSPASVAARPSGVAFAWVEAGPANVTSRLAWRLYDFGLDPTTPKRILDATMPVGGADNPPAIAARGQEIVMVWETADNLEALFVDSQGQLVTPVFLLDFDQQSNGHNRHPDAAFDAAGELTVVWEEGPEVEPGPDLLCGDGSGTSIHGRRVVLSGCPSGALCLLDDRFEVTVAWRDPFNGGSGVGTPVPLTGDTGAFWFFDAENLEMMVKVLDGRVINGHFWVFYGSLTNVEFDLTVRDRQTGAVRVYTNPPFVFASQGDTTAFPGTP